MYIQVEDNKRIFEYSIEFQTVFDNNIAIRMFRYGFERAVETADFRKAKRIISIEFPKQHLILLEKTEGVEEKVTFEIKIPEQETVRYDEFDEEVRSMVKSFYDPKVEEKGIEKGIQKGIEKGINIGEDRKALRIAEKMLQRGESIEDIVELTELSNDKILEIKRKQKH